MRRVILVSSHLERDIDLLSADWFASHGLHPDAIHATDAEVTCEVRTTAPTAPCPLCGVHSSHPHSRYRRLLADQPCQGRRLLLRLTARRFFCRNPDCARRVFAERLPTLALPFARSTLSLCQAHRLLGVALGGEAAARLAGQLAMPASPDTLLRRVLATPDPVCSSVRFVGIDDWAWRKGHTYGTILVDLERGRVIDLLPDRDAATIEKWLRAHPGIEVITRDRWAAYAQAATAAAPQAIQVADRWHLLKNLREAVERLLDRSAPSADATIASDAGHASPAPDAAGAPPEAVPAGRPKGKSQQQREQRFERVRQLHEQGHSARRIAQATGLSRATVLGYLRKERCPDWRPGRSKASAMDEYRDWIDRRIAEGCTNAAELYRRLREQGCTLCSSAVRKYVRKRLGAAGLQRCPAVPPPPVPPVPSKRQLSFAWIRREEERSGTERERVEAVRKWSPAVAEGLELADGFAALVRRQGGETLKGWLERAEASGVGELKRFAQGVRKDEAAVEAATTLAWSNGAVEGQVNRLKLIKRSMCGRAGFALLRARVLHAA